MFTNALVDYLKNSGIENIKVFHENLPAPKSAEPHFVGVLAAGETEGAGNRSITEQTKRFLVTGLAEQAMAKAWEIFNYFAKKDEDNSWAVDTSFDTGNYYVLSVFVVQEPAFVRNVSNIFYVSFSLRFLTAR